MGVCQVPDVSQSLFKQSASLIMKSILDNSSNAEKKDFLELIACHLYRSQYRVSEMSAAVSILQCNMLTVRAALPTLDNTSFHWIHINKGAQISYRTYIFLYWLNNFGTRLKAAWWLSY